MSYTRVNWQDAPSVSTPLTASNLNKMDAGIKQNTDDIEALSDKIYYKEYTVNVSYDAGTPGSRGAQKVFDLDTGVTVVGVFVSFLADSSRYIVIPFISASGATGERLYVNFYRADSSALGAADHAIVRVVYMR